MDDSFSTCDLCDVHAGEVQVAGPIFRHFGDRRAFRGEIVTLVRIAVTEPGHGKVLVVDGGGSVSFAGVTFEPGHYLYADGLIVAKRPF